MDAGGSPGGTSVNGRARHPSRLLPILAAALWVFACGGCEIDDAGRFPPPAVNFLAPAPSWLGIPYEEITLRTTLGNTVHAWFMPADAAKATVLLHHGAVTNRSATYSHYVLLHDLGYNVLVYDYQGFGESYNTPNLDTILSDANAALTHLEQRDTPGADRIIIFGLSLGTLPAIVQAGTASDKVVGVILEGCFVPDSLPPLSLLLVGIVPWADVVASAPPELDPRQYISDIAVPTLFLHSRQDVVTPFDGAQQLHDMATEPKQFIEVAGQHIMAVHQDPAYADTLRTILDGLVGGND